MSYSYVSAEALPDKLGADFEVVNLASKLVKDIFLTYRKVYLTLLLGGEEVFVDMDQLKAQYATYNNTLSVLLLSLGNTALTHIETLPTQKRSYIQYSDIYRIGYSSQLTKIGVSDISGLLKEDLKDIELTRKNYSTDLSLIHKHCLVSVNGFYHMTATDGKRAYVVDAGVSVRKNNMNHIGLTGFNKIGTITKHRFKPSDIYNDTNTSLKNIACFQSPVVLDNRSVILCLGGYLVLPQDNVFWRSGDRELRLNLSALPYLERLFESQNFIDLTSLGLSSLSTNPEALNVQEALSDEVIRRYFALSQSFLIVVNKNNLFWSKKLIRQMLLPGTFTSYQKPVYPLLVGHGRTAEYWPENQGGIWAVSVVDSWYRRYVFSGNEVGSLENITPQLDSSKPYFDSQGALLEIGCIDNNGEPSVSSGGNVVTAIPEPYLRYDLTRRGSYSGNVVQSIGLNRAADDLFTLHVTSEANGELAVLNRFKLNGDVEQTSIDYSLPNAVIGHQGLGIEVQADNDVYFWGGCKNTVQGSGCKVVRYKYKPSSVGTITATEEFVLFPLDTSTQNTSPAISHNFKYLVVEKDKTISTSDFGNTIRLFALSTLNEHGAGDYSSRHLREFYFQRKSLPGVNRKEALQALGCDGKYIYVLSGGMEVTDPSRLVIHDLEGNIVKEILDFAVGKTDAMARGSGTHYEPEGMAFIEKDGQMKVLFQIAAGDTGARACLIYEVDRRWLLA